MAKKNSTSSKKKANTNTDTKAISETPTNAIDAVSSELDSLDETVNAIIGAKSTPKKTDDETTPDVKTKVEAKPEADAKPEAKAKKDAETPKKSPKKKEAAPEIKNIDKLTTALWKKLDKADISAIQWTRAIQVVIPDEETFFIAVRPENSRGDLPAKEITRAEYYDRTGTLFISIDEAFEMLNNKNYDLGNAFADGKFRFEGDIGGAVELISIFIK